ncbi:unnamed protein product, partial [Meganyctiphanes norvegica]
NLSVVTAVKQRGMEVELQREKASNNELQSLLGLHESALNDFLHHHYREVLQALSSGEDARQNLSEQDVRISYFKGLLTEVQTVQEEVEERLQELTAFQQFLAAVTPQQSLQDLKRRLCEIMEEEKLGRSVAVSGSGTGSNVLDDSRCASRAEGEGESDSLTADLATLRMIQ